MATLYESFTGWMHHQASKHDLGDDYVQKEVNRMTQYEFLVALSEALEIITPANCELPSDHVQPAV